MSWVSNAIGKDKRQERRARAQAADPMGRTQNDRRMLDSIESDRAVEGRYSGNVDTSRGQNDAAISGVASWTPSRSNWLSGAPVPGASGGAPGGGAGAMRGQESRGGIPGMATGGPAGGYSRPVGDNMRRALGGDPYSPGGGTSRTDGFPLDGKGPSGWADDAPRFDPNAFVPNYGSSRGGTGGAPRDIGVGGDMFPLDGKGPSGWDPNAPRFDPNSFVPNFGSSRNGGGTGAWERMREASAPAGPAQATGPTPGGMTRNWNPTNVQGLSFDALSRSTPGATDSYSTDGLDTFDSENLRGVDVNGTIDRYTGGPNRFQQAMRGGRTFDPVAQGGNLAAWNDGGLEGYDAGAAVKEYAGGAWNGLQMDLKDLLAEQDAASQRGGRTNSGFWDRDRGRVITDATNRFSNALAGQAVNAAGITADARKAGAQMRLSRATDADRNILDAGLNAQNLTAEDLWKSDASNLEALGLGLDAGKAAMSGALERASGMDANRLAALRASGELGLDAAKFRDDYRYRGLKDASTLNMDRARTLDEMGLDKSKSVDAWDQENAQFGDTMDWNRTKDAADRRERREARDTDTWLALGDRYRDQLTAADDRDSNRRNAKAQAKQNRFQNWISGIGAGVDVLNALNPLKLGIGGK